MMVTVKGYPVVGKHGEAVCVAGVSTDTSTPKWVRLFPVPFRDLPGGQRFSKYDVIEVDEARRPSSDGRPESIRPNVDTLKKLRRIDSNGNWAKRYKYIEPLVIPSMCEMLRLQAESRTSLGVFRPGEVIDLVIEQGDDQWGPSKQAITQQGSLLAPPKSELEKIPYIFKYKYRCCEDDCKGHEQSIIDWEIAAAFRQWRRDYGSEQVALQKLREKWIEVLCAPDVDTHFFVGNQHRHPRSFLVWGVFWPKKSRGPQPSLFDPAPEPSRQ